MSLDEFVAWYRMKGYQVDSMVSDLSTLANIRTVSGISHLSATTLIDLFVGYIISLYSTLPPSISINVFGAILPFIPLLDASAIPMIMSIFRKAFGTTPSSHWREGMVMDHSHDEVSIEAALVFLSLLGSGTTDEKLNAIASFTGVEGGMDYVSLHAYLSALYRLIFTFDENLQGKLGISPEVKHLFEGYIIFF